MAETQEDKREAPDEAEVNNRSAVSLLVEKLRNRLDNWDTDYMAQVIHEGVRAYPNKEIKTSKARGG